MDALPTMCAGEVARADSQTHWPRISIVIPTHNGAKYLEHCIQSVLDQEYPDIECIVMDGGSSDGSVAILQRYDSQLAHWESEKDRGQSHAINKGFARATGEIVNWLGSDDSLLPGALQEVGRRFAEDPSTDVLVGGCYMRHLKNPEKNGPTWTRPETLRLIPLTTPINQPSCFYRRKLLRTPAVNESFHYAMDAELWSYFMKIGARWKFTDAVLSEYLWTGENKTMTGGQKVLRELERLYRAYRPKREVLLPLLMRRLIHPLDKYGNEHKGSSLQPWGTRLQNVVTIALGRMYGFDEFYALFNTYNFFDPPGRPGV